ncbi:hypothetical protein CC117_25945 [Parafrankia colletiae]|uniref:Uncharacterized protein n=1 Tax=Parafrankia colletiae TaxID=573497 RepID=A0A1S1QDE2_9ACTN|nr:hypothetical protein CC117_25945 [Parafrankia colletiae]
MASPPSGSIVSRLLAGLFDDAALFPPGDAPMDAALAAYRSRPAALRTMVGRFVVPAARLGELVETLGRAGPRESPDPVALVVTTTVSELPAVVTQLRPPALTHLSPPGATRVEVVGVDVAGVDVAGVGAGARAESTSLRDALALLAAAGLPAGVAASIEVRCDAAQGRPLDELAAAGRQLKLRTGGPRADLFPGGGELARAVVECAARNLRFRCTAGLHHAVRHTDAATGFEHHGFLNILVAARAAVTGAGSVAVADLLGCRDGAVLVDEIGAWSAADAERARALFTSFGTCSIAEPVGDLVALGLLRSDGANSANSAG